MIHMISPMIRQFAFSKLLSETKELALPYVELPCDTDGQETVDQTFAEQLFCLFTADIIKKDVVFIR